MFAMADAIGLESLRWKRLAILGVAQFTVVLGASIANVALGAQVPVLARKMRTVPAGPMTGMITQVMLIAALLGIIALSGVGLSAAGWVVGITCGAVMNAGLARGLSHYRSDRLSPADWVTLARATLAVGIAALVAHSFNQAVPVTLLVSLAVIALGLDAVDGWVARRTRTTATLGAHFDAEVDAFLILVLSVYVARPAGAWVLAIGAARYAFLAAGWLLPWMREPLPPRYWRKVVAATQGIVLTIAAADVLPPALTQAILVAALALLAESFGRDVWWLWSTRHATHARAAVGASPTVDLAVPTLPRPRRGRGRVRTNIGAALTIVALLVVWSALVAPVHPIHLTPSAFVRVPLEGLALIAVALVLPATARRLLACIVGPVLALVVILKILDIGFFAGFDRPFDPYLDASYAGIGSETLRASIGASDANLVLAGVAVLAVALLVFMTLAVLRVTRVAAGHRWWSLRAITALGVVWVLFWVSGARLISDTPIASTSAADLVLDKVRTLQADLADHAVFAKEISHDRFRDTPGDQLLTGLRGKDVLLAFVESYGRVAVQGSSFSPQVSAAATRFGQKRKKKKKKTLSSGPKVGLSTTRDQVEADRINLEMMDEAMDVILCYGDEFFKDHGSHWDLPPPGIPTVADRSSSCADPSRARSTRSRSGRPSPPRRHSGRARPGGFGGVFWLLHHELSSGGSASPVPTMWHHSTASRPGRSASSCRYIRVEDTHEQAWSRTGPHGSRRVLEFSVLMGGPGVHGRRRQAGPAGADPTLEESVEQKVWLIGSPEEVAEGIAGYRDALVDEPPDRVPAVPR